MSNQINEQTKPENNGLFTLLEQINHANEAFEQPDAITLLNAIKAEVFSFTTKYTAVLDKLNANASAEAELIAKLTKSIDLLIQ